MQPVTVHRRVGNRRVRVVEPCGGVFAPNAPQGITRPVTSLGPPGAKVTDPIFTCPVSAIPEAVTDLIELWWACRAVRVLPRTGGLLDQALIVQRAFPILEREYAVVERERGAAESASGVAAAMSMLFGGSRR